ncbi:MAG: hypothetical protein HN846_02505 [Candidatus Pacebacteria bacterium]|jgi:hypothetical protein|nr:hypothetical protein [Candidatus Paceibacterota bacterium]MBT3512294.1 hypothetical protein [Candidatus Paceibacterota bacterium]MBT4004512.1 hypothetical protein [Candidatus Paceibacterota bacterium]MBT4358844.1 hypothetical protein [Candidatus Paceibacterota bacterium]MBT4681207.1 hypothetical protein [Candidatus Paceibacterota bacterium]
MLDLQEKTNNIDQKDKDVDTDFSKDQGLPIRQSFLKKNKPVFLIGALLFLVLITTISLFFNKTRNQGDQEKNISKESQDVLLTKLLSREYKEDDQIWIEAFIWKEIELPDFKLKIPTCDKRNEEDGCYDFSFTKSNENDSLVPDCVKIGRSFPISNYYDPAQKAAVSGNGNSNHIYLGGGLVICKLNGENAGLSPGEYIEDKENKILGKCKGNDDSWALLDGFSQQVILENKHVQLAEYKPTLCYDKTDDFVSGTIPYYVVEFNKNLYGFHGGQDPLPGSVMREIFESIEINHSDLFSFIRSEFSLSERAIIEIKIDEKEYVYGTAGEPDSGGFYWAAVKDSGQWNYAMSGNGIPSCEEVEIFPIGTFNGKFDGCYQDGTTFIDRAKQPTYINEEYGFSFDYPITEGYQIFESDENNRDALKEISVAKPNTSSSSFEVFVYKSDLSAKDWWENVGIDIQNNLWSEVVVKDIASLIVAGRNAYHVEISVYGEESGRSFKMNVVSKDGYIYLFEVHHKEIGDYSDGEQTLSSVKFLTSSR